MGWLATLFMGFTLGLLGGGGGILTVPILVGFFGFSATSATGASLLIVGLTSAVGAVQGIVKKQCEAGPALLLVIPSMLGAIIARLFLVPALPNRIFGLARDQVLLGAFATLMVLVGLRMLTSKPMVGAKPKLHPWVVLFYGLAIGVLSGSLGAGGGFLILPVLTLLLGVEMERAIPTSLLVISIQSLGGFIGELGKTIDWKVLLQIAGVALLGLGIGLPLRERAPRKALQFAFALLVLSIAGWMFAKIL